MEAIAMDVFIAGGMYLAYKVYDKLGDLRETVAAQQLTIQSQRAAMDALQKTVETSPPSSVKGMVMGGIAATASVLAIGYPALKWYSRPTNVAPGPRYAPAAALNATDGCVVCLSDQKDTCLFPCRHLCLCWACSDRVTVCPLCREAVTSRVHLFVS